MPTHLLRSSHPLMRISPRAHWGIVMMIDLALHQHEGPVPLSRLRKSMGLSVSYMEKLLSELRQTGLVRGTRGHLGGYTLAMPAPRVSMADIVFALNRDDVGINAQMKKSQGGATGKYGAPKAARDILNALDRKSREYLASITLQDALDGTYSGK